MCVYLLYDCFGCYYCFYIVEDNKYYLLVIFVNFMCVVDCIILKFILSCYEYFFFLLVLEFRGWKDVNGEVVDFVFLILFEYFFKFILYVEDVNVK